MASPQDLEERSATPSTPDILLVEDDVDQAHLVKFLLEDGGERNVILAQDGVSAMRYLEDRDWDLLITDINLPGADGIAVVEASRRLRPHLPILATTGYTGPEYGARARERGANAVLIKPLDRDDLLHHVQELLAGAGPTWNAPPDQASGIGATLRPPPGEGRETVSLAPPQDSEARTVLAISPRPGDAEAGCGAALILHGRAGDRVMLLHLSPGEILGGNERDRTKEAGLRLGAKAFLANVGSPVQEEGWREASRLVQGAMKELKPDVLYLPSMHHESALHRRTHQAALESAEDVPLVLAYDAGDASSTFSPSLFLPIPEDLLLEKAHALDAYSEWALPHLQFPYLRATATFWARFSESALVEPLEAVRGTLSWTRIPARRAQ